MDPQKLHALLVHLPAGLILLATPASLISLLGRRCPGLHWLAIGLFSVAALTAAVTARMGFAALSTAGPVTAAHVQKAIYLHKTAGLILPILALSAAAAMALFEWTKGPVLRVTAAFLSGAVAVALVIVGYQGGILVYDHGVGIGQSKGNHTTASGALPDAALLTANADPDGTEEMAPVQFSIHIKPILDSKCTACHNEYIRSGGISLIAYEDIVETEGLVAPGAPEKSRVALAVTKAATKRMPPMGAPLSDGEVRLLARWIASGAGQD